MTSSFELFKKQLDDAVELIEQSSTGELGDVNLPATLDDIVDTTSLLERCDSICDKYESKKPTIRIIHHLACSGGAELVKYISAMPNVYLLNEVHPFIRAKNESPSLELTSKTKDKHMPFNVSLNGQIFLDNIKTLHQHVSQLGLDLVISDNAFFDYLSEERLHRKSIVGLLENEFNILSVVLHRDTIDTFASLANSDFFQHKKLSFNEYCERALSFILDYSSANFISYEDLSGSTEKTVKNVCKQLKIGFNDCFELMQPEINQPKFDAWKASEIDRYNTKLETRPSFEEVGQSESYFELQKKLKPKDKKLILISTMPRSGSTWLYNCVREIFKCLSVNFYSDWIDDYEPGNINNIHIVKVHEPEWRLSSQADIIISTRRDVRDVCVSLIRMGWLENEANSILKYADYIINFLHPFWKERSNLEIEYNDITCDPAKIVSSIAKLVGVSCSLNEIQKIETYLSNLKSPEVYDKETQLHPGHRSSEIGDFARNLPQGLNKQLYDHHHTWFNRFNYSY